MSKALKSQSANMSKAESARRKTGRVPKMICSGQSSDNASAQSPHCYLLKLPLELRVMIYRATFATKTNRALLRDPWHQHKLPGLSLLTVNKQVSSEAKKVMQDTQTFFMAVDDHELCREQEAPLRTFTNIILELPMYDAVFLWDTLSITCQLLRQVNGFLAQCSTAEKQAKISLQIRLRGYAGTENTMFDPDHEGGDFISIRNGADLSTEDWRYFALFLKAQFEFMFGNMRVELRPHLPDATITTNADATWRDVEYHRIDEFTVRFKDMRNNRLGTVSSYYWVPVVKFEKFDEEAKI